MCARVEMLAPYIVETVVHFRIDWKQYEAQPNLFEMAWKGRYVQILTHFDMRICISISELREVDEVDCLILIDWLVE